MKHSKNELVKWACCLALLQILDGVLTVWGVSNFGSGVEGNPLVKCLIDSLGAEPALFIVKLFGVLLSFLFVYLRALKILIFITGLYGGVVLIWVRFWLFSTFGN